jgi:dipeptidase D
MKLPVSTTDSPAGTKPYRLNVSGMLGGHSGIDINAGRGNAIKVLARVLEKALANQPCHLVSLQGGSKRNAIPREASAELMILETAVDDVAAIVGDELAKIKAEIGGIEKDLAVAVEPSDEVHAKVLDKATQDAVLKILLEIPHGVFAMSKEIPDLVETSNNLATVHTTGSDIVVGTSTRSSIAEELQAHRDRVHAVAEAAGVSYEENEPYPGWAPNLDSKLLGVVKAVHASEFGKEIELKAIHAGLECGIIGEKYPGMDMISIGPWIEHPHSPGERVNIPSVETFWKLVTAVMKELA